MTYWFGESWGAPICELDNHVATPEGVCCLTCEEPILAGDAGIIHSQIGLDALAAERDPRGVLATCGHRLVAKHLECHLRGVLGSVGHIEGRCSCFGGDEEDPPGLSRREAARAAVAAYERRYGVRAS